MLSPIAASRSKVWGRELRALAFSLPLALLPELSPALQAPGAVAGQQKAPKCTAGGRKDAVLVFAVTKQPLEDDSSSETHLNQVLTIEKLWLNLLQCVYRASVKKHTMQRNWGQEKGKGIYYQKSAWAPPWHKERIGLLSHFLLDREGALVLSYKPRVLLSL